MRTKFSILLSALLVFSTVLWGQVKESDNLISLNIAPVFGSDGYFKESISGGAVGFTYEKMISSNLGLGVNFSVIGATGEYDNPNITNRKARSNYRSVPSYLTGRYVFLDGKFQLYLALGLGFTYTTVTSELEVDEGSFAASFAVPIGFYWFISDDFFFNGNYTPIWYDGGMSSDPGIVSAINLGFGWTWPPRK